MVATLACLLLTSAVSALLYSWLGMAYAMSLMTLLSLTEVSVNEALAAILGSQAVAALMGSYFRRSLVNDVNASVKHSIVIGLSALSSFMAALTLGVRLSEDVRLLSVAVMLLFTAILVRFEVKLGRGFSDNNTGNVFAGVAAGFMKGVLGAGVTPMLISLQRLAGLNFDETMFRTLLAEIVICLAALIPYSIAYGVEPLALITLCVGSALGVVLGRVLLKPLGQKTRSLLSFVVMVLFSAVLFIELSVSIIPGLDHE